MSLESDYNQRQLRHMAEEIEQFEAGKISMTRFLARLKGLLGALEGCDSEWRQAFLDAWGQLEVANAMKLADSEMRSSRSAGIGQDSDYSESRSASSKLDNIRRLISDRLFDDDIGPTLP